MGKDEYCKAAGEMFLQVKKKEQAERKRDSQRRMEAAINEAAGYLHAKARGRKYFY